MTTLQTLTDKYNLLLEAKWAIDGGDPYFGSELVGLGNISYQIIEYKTIHLALLQVDKQRTELAATLHADMPVTKPCIYIKLKGTLLRGYKKHFTGYPSEAKFKARYHQQIYNHQVLRYETPRCVYYATGNALKTEPDFKQLIIQSINA